VKTYKKFIEEGMKFASASKMRQRNKEDGGNLYNPSKNPVMKKMSKADKNIASYIENESLELSPTEEKEALKAANTALGKTYKNFLALSDDAGNGQLSSAELNKAKSILNKYLNV
jgi:hypothetical protein